MVLNLINQVCGPRINRDLIDVMRNDLNNKQLNKMIMKGETFFISSTKTNKTIRIMNATTIKITNIEWDTDGEFIDDLPTEYIYEPDEDETIEEAEDIIADLLSDEFGWCVCGFNLQEEWSQN